MQDSPPTGSHASPESLVRKLLPVCVMAACYTALVPFIRAFFRTDLEYNEGWNVYNASTVAHHGLLYARPSSWTSVNYPMLSFSIVAWLHAFTGSYLFTARVLSLLALLATGILIAAIVRRLGGLRLAANLAGLLCIAVFCANAHIYVGVNDPQILAQSIFLLALYVYLRDRRSRSTLLLSALLFVIGGSIKHNLVDIPIAVCIDLLLESFASAVWFVASGAVFATVAVAINIRFGGPFFFAQLLSPRDLSSAHMLGQFINVWAPLVLPMTVAVFIAVLLRRNPQQRIASILLVCTTLIGGIFGGGSGVSINTLFDTLLAMSILLGLGFSHLMRMENSTILVERLQQYGPATCFLWLSIPLIISGNWNPVAALHRTVENQRTFDEAVAVIEAHPGPALCESLLLCYFAGKPYVYDPFNATRLVEHHRLDETSLLSQLQHQEFGTIELSALPKQCQDCAERFPSDVLTATQTYYRPALQLDGFVLLTPKSDTTPPQTAPTQTAQLQPLRPHKTHRLTPHV